MERIHRLMNKVSLVSKKSFDEYIELCTLRNAKAGDILIEVGTIPKCLFFIKSGIARSYSHTEKGVEHIRSLVSENNILTSTEALIKKEPSKIACQCLTDCELLEINYKDILKIFKSNFEISSWYTRTVELNYALFQKINDEILTLNSTERYLKLQRRIPDIDNRINQYHIAASLGITPIQLSRIRKKIYKK